MEPKCDPLLYVSVCDQSAVEEYDRPQINECTPSQDSLEFFGWRNNFIIEKA